MGDGSGANDPYCQLWYLSLAGLADRIKGPHYVQLIVDVLRTVHCARVVAVAVAAVAAAVVVAVSAARRGVR